MLYSLSGASVCAFKICVQSKNFIRSFFQSQISSWSVSTYICSARGVIQLIRSKCVRFQDFSRANTSPPPPSSLFASTSGSFFFQKTNSNLNPCSASLFASNTKIFLQHYPMTIWWAITFWNRYVSNYKYKSYTLLSCFPLNVLWEKNLGVVILLFENMMNY